MKTIVYFLLCCIAFMPRYAHSFCGFYVAKADTELFNEKSEVILTRDGFETVLTMSNDFKGDVKDFAMVIPVPTVLSRNNIKVVDRYIFDRLNGYSGPRLVEYYDEHPCYRYDYRMMESRSIPAMEVMEDASGAIEFDDYQVTIEASYVENDNPAPKATEIDQEAEYFRASALPEGHKTDLKVHQFKWQQLGWMDYRLRIDVTAFLPPDLTQAIVTVEGGLVSNVKMTRTDDTLAATHFAYKESVDGLFRRLNQSLEREPHRYTAEFHPTLFYPTQAYIDFDERIADEETGFQVSMLGPTSVVDSLDTLPPSDAVEIVKSSVSDNELSLDLRYGGGCAAHFFALVKAGHSSEGRLQLRLIHDANDDRCRAFVFETRAFDLTPILASPQGDDLSFEIISGHPSNEKTHLVTLTP